MTFVGAEIDRLEIEIEAAAAKANRELEKLVTGLEKVQGKLSKISTKSISNTFAHSDNKTGSTTNNLIKSVAQASKQIAGLNKRSAKSFSQLAWSFYANYYLIIRGLKKLQTSIQKSMDYVETYNYFSVTMDKIGNEFSDMYEQYGYDSAEAYANSFKTRLNQLTEKMTGYSVGTSGELTMTDSIGLALDPEAIMNFQSSIAAVTNSVGLIGENSVNASKALTMLAADMSSLKNISLSTAMTNFQSGLIGQSRALYKYGIDITNATLQTYAYELGLSKAVSEMTQAEKMQLRLIAILNQSKVAWGDAANTINSVANQYRILKQQISNLARVIGNLFLPIVQKVLPFVNGLLIALQRLFNVLGFKLWGNNWLKDTMDGISGVGSSAFDSAEESTDDTAKNLENANKAAERLRTTVLGIDELNINSPDTDTGSSNTGTSVGGIDLSGAIGDALAEYESVWDEAFKNAENKAQEFADRICNVFTRIWNAVEPFRNALKQLWDEGLSLLMGYTFQNLIDFYNEFLVPIGMWAFGTEDSGLTRLVNIINERLMQIDWVWISDNLRKFWIAIEPYAEQFGEGLIDFFEDISKIPVAIINGLFGRDGVITRITDWLESHDEEKARSWGYSLGILATGLLALSAVSSAIVGLATIGNTLISLSTGLGALFGPEGIFANIGNKIAGIFTPFLSSFTEMIGLVSVGAGTLSDSFAACFPTISSLLASLNPLIVALAALAAGIAFVFATNEEVRQSFANLVGTLTSGLMPVLSELGSGIIAVLSEALMGFWNNVLVPIGALVGDVLSPLLLMISELLTSLCQNIVIPLADALGTIFLAALQAVADIFVHLTEQIKPVIAILQFLWNSVLLPIADYLWTGFKPVFENVFRIIGELITNFGTILSGLIKFVTGVFTGDWKKAWNGVKDVFKGVFNSIVTIAEGVINWIIDGINNFLDGFNGIVTKIGDVIGIDIKIPTLSPVSLPRFEKGGFPETGQLFMARENGINEMVGSIGHRSAVANNDQIVESVTYGVRQGVREAVAEILAPYLSDIAKNTRETADKDFSVKLGDREVYKSSERGRQEVGYALIT